MDDDMAAIKSSLPSSLEERGEAVSRLVMDILSVGEIRPVRSGRSSSSSFAFGLVSFELLMLYWGLCQGNKLWNKTSYFEGAAGMRGVILTALLWYDDTSSFGHFFEV